MGISQPDPQPRSTLLAAGRPPPHQLLAVGIPCLPDKLPAGENPTGPPRRWPWGYPDPAAPKLSPLQQSVSGRQAEAQSCPEGWKSPKLHRSVVRRDCTPRGSHGRAGQTGHSGGGLGRAPADPSPPRALPRAAGPAPGAGRSWGGLSGPAALRAGGARHRQRRGHRRRLGGVSRVGRGAAVAPVSAGCFEGLRIGGGRAQAPSSPLEAARGHDGGAGTALAQYRAGRPPPAARGREFESPAVGRGGRYPHGGDRALSVPRAARRSPSRPPPPPVSRTPRVPQCGPRWRGPAGGRAAGGSAAANVTFSRAGPGRDSHPGNPGGLRMGARAAA